MRALVILMFALLLAGCRSTRYVPVESVRTEYVTADTTGMYARLSKAFEAKLRKEVGHDSLVDRLREVIVLTSEGDTARHDRERIVYRASHRELELIDSINQKDSIISSLRERLASIKLDTIREPIMIERELTRWEKAKMDFGGIAFGAVGVVVLFLIGWFVRRFKRL